MKIHNTVVSAFCHADERDGLKTALSNILPDGTEVTESRLGPETEGEIFVESLLVLSANLDRKKSESFLNKVLDNLDKQDMERLRSEVELRTDDGCNFYIRLDKEQAYKGRYVLHNEDPIHVKIKIAVYPAKRENAIEEIRRMLT